MFVLHQLAALGNRISWYSVITHAVLADSQYAMHLRNSFKLWNLLAPTHASINHIGTTAVAISWVVLHALYCVGKWTRIAFNNHRVYYTTLYIYIYTACTRMHDIYRGRYNVNVVCCACMHIQCILYYNLAGDCRIIVHSLVICSCL